VKMELRKGIRIPIIRLRKTEKCRSFKKKDLTGQGIPDEKGSRKRNKKIISENMLSGRKKEGGAQNSFDRKNATDWPSEIWDQVLAKPLRPGEKKKELDATGKESELGAHYGRRLEKRASVGKRDIDGGDIRQGRLKKLRTQEKYEPCWEKRKLAATEEKNGKRNGLKKVRLVPERRET